MKCSLPVGLGLSETKITSHGFDVAKEGVVEAGQFPSKGKWVFLIIFQFKILGIFLHGQKYSVLFFEQFGWVYTFEIYISDNQFIISYSWVVKIENICYTCCICQATRGNYLMLSWSAMTGREGLVHLELVPGWKILLVHCIEVFFKFHKLLLWFET